MEAAELREAAHFFARTIGGDPRYISHGEIQCGLSPDGKTWADNLDALLVEDMAEIGPDRSVLVARTSDGAMVAAAIILWVDAGRLRFAVIEDLSVDPAARSHGIGAIMVAAVEAEAKRRGMAWAFLESGQDNEGAHAFFERHGFHQLSHTFGKRL